MDAKVSIILNCTKNINRVYKLQEFKVTNIIMDGKFEPSKEILKVWKSHLLFLNDEHVGDINRLNKSVKEQVCGIYNTLYFKRMLGKLMVKMVIFSVLWINFFQASQSMAWNLIQFTIVTKQLLSLNKHRKIDFGEHMKNHEDHGNNMETGTVGAIYLCSILNKQGGYYF